MIRILVIVSISLASVTPAAARGQDVTVEASPRAVTLGAETGADVRVLLAGAPAPRARWASTIGRVEAGRFDPGDHQTPAYVIVAAVVPAPDEREHRGATVLELVGRGELDTHTSPGALVTVEIEDRRFGPLRADGEGNVSIPVEVPPGAARAKVLAVDRRGLETARERALPASEWPRGLVVAPQRLSPGETGVVTVFAIDGRGAWRRSKSGPVFASSARSLRVGGVRPVAPGRWDAEVSVESDASGGPIVLAASIDGEALAATTVEIAGPLAAGGSGTPSTLTAAQAPRVERILVGLHAGLAFAAADAPSKLAAVDVAIPLRLVGPLRLHVVAALGMAFGEGTDQQDRPADLTQLYGAVGVHLRVPFGRRFFAEAGVGAGLGWMSVDLYRKNGGFLRNDSDTAALGYAALGFGVRLGPGELALEARWIEAQFDPFQKIVEGTALGFTPTLGYRLVF